jgi:quercetin dioxygenase-like cupin family protein
MENFVLYDEVKSLIMTIKKIIFFTIVLLASIKMKAQTISAEPLDITDQIDFTAEKFNSKVLFKNEAFNLVLFALQKGQEIKAHTTPRDAYLQCLKGEVIVIIAEKTHTLKKGQIILLPKDILHAIKAEKKVKLMLIK